ncbi:nucleotidyltransferase family protein [Nostoc sp. CHAB 5844]|nr:nucleotidyltransferase family protein [Nostoc sp. CHAB 5844]
MSTNLPEVQLVLSCAHTQRSPALNESIRKLCTNQINWMLVQDLSSRNGIDGLLWESLQSVGSAIVPISVLNTLQQNYQAYILKGMICSRELLRLLQDFETHQIPMLPYKGPTLAIAIYGSYALRYFSDLDILIHPDDLVVAKALLVNNGYETLSVDDAQEKLNTWSDSERDFLRPNNHVSVDLHWRVTPQFFSLEMPFEVLWQRRQSVTLLDTSVTTFSPEDLLLVLCVHGSKECWSQLKWICDLAELLQTYPHLDWQVVEERSQMLHCRRMLLLGLKLAQELLQAQIPQSLQAAIAQDSRLPWLSQQVIWRLFSDQIARSASWQTTLFRLSVRDRPGDWVQYFIWRLLIPNVRDRRVLKLADSLSFLYYLIRPIRLVVEQVCSMAK